MESGSQAMTTEAGLVFSTAETWNATFENNSTEEMNSFYFYQTEQVTVLWILFVLIVLGNSAVLAALLLDSKGRKSRMNFFIMHLAFADLSVGLISVLTDIVWRITVTWHAGHVACKLIRFSQGMVTYSSTYVLVVLSIDRYDAITHPMNFSGSWRRSRILVAVAWLLSAVFSIPLLILYEEKEIQGKLQCWIELDQWQWQVYMVLVSVSLFFIPALIITFCYAVIVITIWSKSKMLTGKKKRCHRNGSHRNSSSRSREDADSRRASSRGIIPRAKIKTVKMTFIIVFVFVLCWSPYMVFDLLQVFGHVPNTQTNIAVATFIQSLAPLNSAANPLIYCFFSTPICRTLRRVPPLSWLSICFPDMQRRRQEANSRCLRYGGTNSTTMTETMTHLSTRRNVRLAANQQSSNYCRQPPPRVAVTLV